MEGIVILLLIVILIVLITLKNYVTDNFKKIEFELQLLRKRITDSNPPPASVVKPEIKSKPVNKEDEAWQSSFKRMDEPQMAVEKDLKTQPEKISTDPIRALESADYTPISKTSVPPANIRAPKPSFFERNPDLEKFIGENLVSKIGIAILVLAIGFFVKFAIDSDWIGPVGRVGIGLLAGGILVFLAHRLRTNYKAFSSVLVGGGLAVFYFTITLAYH